MSGYPRTWMSQGSSKGATFTTSNAHDTVFTNPSPTTKRTRSSEAPTKPNGEHAKCGSSWADMVGPGPDCPPMMSH